MQSPSDRWFGAGRSIASDSAKAGAEATAAAVDGRTSELVFCLRLEVARTRGALGMHSLTLVTLAVA
jgi:hypothetical protein